VLRLCIWILAGTAPWQHGRPRAMLCGGALLDFVALRKSQKNDYPLPTLCEATSESSSSGLSRCLNAHTAICKNSTSGPCGPLRRISFMCQDFTVGGLETGQNHFSSWCWIRTICSLFFGSFAQVLNAWHRACAQAAFFLCCYSASTMCQSYLFSSCSSWSVPPGWACVGGEKCNAQRCMVSSCKLLEFARFCSTARMPAVARMSAVSCFASDGLSQVDGAELVVCLPILAV
jgi:hypothetical protein